MQEIATGQGVHKKEWKEDRGGGRKYLEHKEAVERKSDSRGCGRTRLRQQRRRRLQNQGGPHRKSEGGTKELEKNRGEAEDRKQ